MGLRRGMQNTPLHLFRRLGSTSIFYAVAVILTSSCVAGFAEEGDARPSPSMAITVQSGLWGTVESFPVILEPPSTHLWEALYDTRSFWSFAKLSQEECYALFPTLGFSDSTIALIRSNGVWEEGATGTEVTIDDAIVESLSNDNRAALAKWFRLQNYSFFGKSVVNIEGGDLSAFEKSNLRPETLDLVRSVFFHRGKVLSVLDRPYLMRRLGEDREEKEKLIRALFATRSLLVRLVINETTDLDSVIKYWSANGQVKGIESILRGVYTTAGVENIDIIELLPPLPRKYLYGFTNLLDIGPTNTPDCYWAAIQFFKTAPSPRLLDPLVLNHYLDHDYDLVTDEPQFGDVVCMFDRESREFLHSYVHIAGNIVFTKNGASYARPFVLTAKADMLSVYSDESTYFTRVYRLKR